MIAALNCERVQFRADVIAGLSQAQKTIPAKYFYDEAGSRLFDHITHVDEYYLTRCECDIMHRYAAAMAARLGPHCLLIEFGGGSLVKVRMLLDHLERPAGYVPVDVSGPHLMQAAAQLELDYPHLDVIPVCADFTKDFPLPADLDETARRVVYFPGSTIGNFAPLEADALLRHIATMVGPGGGLLLGVDLQKDPAVIHAAYNDRRGVTAAFNHNLLIRMNRELGADFDPDAFTHRAIYHTALQRIEMHLISNRRQTVHLAGHEFTFQRDESIHTENSYKFDSHTLARRANHCGLQFETAWYDDRRYFGVLLFVAR